MKTVGHLTTYTVNLEVQSPLFIGSGEKITKKEYLLDTHKNTAVMFDLQKLADYLLKKNLMKQYQNYLLDDREKNIYYFFRNNNIRPQEYAQFTDYSINTAGESLNMDQPLHDLNLFVKDAQGNPYIPGSSLKGALRTAMLVYLIYYDEDEDKKRKAERMQQWRRGLDNCPTKKDKEKYLRNAKGFQFAEADWLHELDVNVEDKKNMVNSIMRGISVSDSNPLSTDDLMLVQKIDVSVKGKPQTIPLLRECLRPGANCKFTITFDNVLLKESGWTIDKLFDALNLFRRVQKQFFFDKFTGYEIVPYTKTDNILWLGGGVGFVNKTLNQVLLGPNNALEYNKTLLEALFPNGHHEKDMEIGISPHMIKVAAYKGKHHPMGQCKLEVLD